MLNAVRRLPSERETEEWELASGYRAMKGLIGAKPEETGRVLCVFLKFIYLF